MATKLQIEECMSRYLHRWVRMKDIEPGKELLMVELSPEFCNHIDPTLVGTLIQIDKLEDDTVFYHCINPTWNGQCFVPLDTFLKHEYKGGWTSERMAFWIPE